jgi:hypothetical protein
MESRETEILIVFQLFVPTVREKMNDTHCFWWSKIESFFLNKNYAEQPPSYFFDLFLIKYRILFWIALHYQPWRASKVAIKNKSTDYAMSELEEENQKLKNKVSE